MRLLDTRPFTAYDAVLALWRGARRRRHQCLGRYNVNAPLTTSPLVEYPTARTRRRSRLRAQEAFVKSPL